MTVRARHDGVRDGASEATRFVEACGVFSSSPSYSFVIGQEALALAVEVEHGFDISVTDAANADESIKLL